MYKALIAVLLMALVTYIPRVIPVSIFRKEIKSVYIKSFLKYVPYAVLGSLTFPEIFYSTDNAYSAIAGTITAFYLAYKEKSLVTVALASILTVFLTGFIFH